MSENDSVQNTAPEVYSILPGEVRNVTVSFDGKLSPGDSLTGTPVVTASPTLTITNKVVSVSALWVESHLYGWRLVPSGRAVLFQVSGAADDTEYTISVECGTVASPAQTVKGRIVLVGASE